MSSLEHPSLSISHENSHPIRNAVTMLAIGAVVGGAVTEGFRNALMYDARHASEHWTPAEAYAGYIPLLGDSPADEALMVVPGMGVRSGKEMAEAVGPAFMDFGIKPAFLQFPSHPKSIEEIAEKINWFAENRVRPAPDGRLRMGWLLSSMAGVTFQELRPHLNEKIETTFIAYFNSPRTIRDVKRAHERTATRLIGRCEDHIGGTALKATATYLRHKLNTQASDRSNAACVAEVRKALDPTNSSPRQWVWQMNQLRHASSGPIATAGNERVAYVLPDNPDNDGVVKVIQSYGAWSRDYGFPLDQIIIPEIEHAKPCAKPQVSQAAFRDWLSTFRTPVTTA